MFLHRKGLRWPSTSIHGRDDPSEAHPIPKKVSLVRRHGSEGTFLRPPAHKNGDGQRSEGSAKNLQSDASEESVTPDSPDTRLCGDCFLPKPIEDFRLRYRGRALRLRQCRECHNRAERFRLAARRNRLTKRQMAQSLTAIKNQRSDLGVKALCREMAARFGGVEGIVEHWQRSLDIDIARGGYAAFRHLAAIMRLTQYCEQNKPDYGGMSDEELEGAIWALGGPDPRPSG